MKESFHPFVGVALDIGDRSGMEDEFQVFGLSAKEVAPSGVAYLGAYDGHAGSLTSSFVRDSLSQVFFSKCKGKQLHFKSQKMESAMKEAFFAVDDLFFAHEEQERQEGGHKEQSGSTAASVVVHPSTWAPIRLPFLPSLCAEDGWGMVAGAGDSRVVLFHQGKVVVLSTDHRINRSGVPTPESERIISLVGPFSLF